MTLQMIRAGRMFALIAFGFAPGLAAAAPGTALTSYVLLGPDGVRIARVITAAAQCPDLILDGAKAPMSLRAPAETVPQRPTASAPEASKSSVFDGAVCEAVIPAKVHSALVAGRVLPLPPAVIRRMVVIGDTGCRVKGSDKAYQACNDPKAYPFAQVAATAAAWKPDLVLHVGDYLYRETACPEGQAGCAGSAWGYGADAWRQDFFDPAAPLLAAAPLALARGNHETCVRAGQGWRRYLDASAYIPERSCNAAADDGVGDFTDPYAIPLGDHAQLIMFDSADTPTKPLDADDPRAVHYRDAYRRIEALASASPHSILVDHHPILGFGAKKDKEGAVNLFGGNGGLQSVFGAFGPRMAPAGVDLLIAGHVHLWEAVSFSGDFPGQIVNGFSGTQEDVVPLPAAAPPGATPAPGAMVEAMSSWVDGFGFMTLERRGDDAWDAQIRDVTGAVVNTCEIRGRRVHCAVAQVASGR